MNVVKSIRTERILHFNEVYLDQFNALRDAGTQWNQEQGSKYLQNLDNALFLAFIEKQIIGFLTAYRLQRLDKMKAEILIYEICVNENFRQKGAGKALIQKTKDWAKEVEADEVWVLTNKSNKAAMALYKSLEGIIENDDEQMFTFKISQS